MLYTSRKNHLEKDLPVEAIIDDPQEAEKRFVADVLAAAAGKWSFFFEDRVPELAQAMHNSPFHVPCPVHGGSDGFRLFPDYAKTGGGICNTCKGKPNGVVMLAWIRGHKDQVRAAEEINAWLTGQSQEAIQRREPPPPPKPKVDPVVAKRRIMEVWKSSSELKHSAAELYLASRGIWVENMPKVLRSHDGLRYYHGKQNTYYGTFPALLAPVRDANHRLVSLHRIFLDDAGSKAPVPDAKKMMSACDEIRGAAIKLFEPTDVLGVGEGIETVLAAHAISRMPVWSCISATLMELVQIPDHVKLVVIWADLDVSGRGVEAAEKLADRLEKEGKRVEICIPPGAIPEGEKGIDWLDVLNRYGVSGFPARWRRWRPPVVERPALAA